MEQVAAALLVTKERVEIIYSSHKKKKPSRTSPKTCHHNLIIATVQCRGERERSGFKVVAPASRREFSSPWTRGKWGRRRRRRQFHKSGGAAATL